MILSYNDIYPEFSIMYTIILKGYVGMIYKDIVVYARIIVVPDNMTASICDRF